MSIPVIDTLHSLGDFPVVNSDEVQCGSVRLDAVLSASETEVNSKASKTYVDSELSKKATPADITTAVSGKADKTYVDSNFAKKSEIPTNYGTYSKPVGGIPKSDFANDVQASLGKADTAIQSHQSLANYVTTSDSRLSDSRPASDVSAWAKENVKPTYTKSEVGLSNVDNTSDMSKPISSATQSALNLKADASNVSAIDSRVSQNESDIAIQTARIDNISSLEEGSTTGDAELADIRVKTNGKTATDAGTAVREEVGEIEKCLVKSTNLINPSEIVNGLLDTDGTVKNSETGYYTSGYINVSEDANKTIYFSNKSEGAVSAHSVAVYDANKNLVTRRAYWIRSVTTESNWKYIRVCFSGTRNIKAEYDKVTPWQDYTGTEFEPVLMTAGTACDTKLVPVTKALSIAKNLTNPEYIETGLLTSTGTINTSESAYFTSGYIDVNGHANSNIYFTGKAGAESVHSICAYDSNKQFITRLGYWIKDQNIESSWKYIRYSTYNTSSIMAEWDGHTKYATYTTDKFIPCDEVAKGEFYGELQKVRTDDYVICPSKIRTISGSRFFLYHENMVFNGGIDTYRETAFNGVSCTDFDDCFLMSDNPTTGTKSGILYYEPYNTNFQRYAQKNVDIVNLSDTNTGKSKKVIFIGDSLTDAGIYTQKLLSMFTGSDSIELLGTRGSGTNKHEGRAGWRAYTYTHFASVTSSDDEGTSAVNAFWNPSSNKFDFSYYMTQQGYSDVDYVFICLGTNDQQRNTHKSDTEMISAWNEIITSIKTFNPNVKIGLWLAPNRSTLTNKNSVQMQKAQRTTKLLIDTYDNKESENIYLVPVYINVNPKADYNSTTVTVDGITKTLCTDEVHVNEQGYLHIARVIYAYVKHMMYM